jgi:GT2 family glycosyltransferase
MMPLSSNSHYPLPGIAVILVNWNSYDVTRDCLDSLRKVQYPNYKVIVVDNGSVDGSGQRLQTEYPEIVVLYTGKNLGFTGGNNTGFRFSIENGFDYSMMLNNDTFVEPDFLGHLVKQMEENRNIGAIQPRIYLHPNRSLLWNGGSYYNRLLGFAYTKGESREAKKEHLVLKKVDWVTGCAFFVRNSILQDIGLLAENMFIYSEDVDLSFRIREKGYDLFYEPASVVYHIAGSSNKNKVKGREGYLNPIVHYLNQRNRIWLLKRYTKWYAVPTVAIANFFYSMMVISYFVLRGRFSKVRAVKDGIRDGLLGSIGYTKA